MYKCNHCRDTQQVAEYVYPDGHVMRLMYACQLCGRGKQEDAPEVGSDV